MMRLPGCLAAAETMNVKPCVVLVRPQMGDNIGAAARAMMNCGLDDLRLVGPRDGWPNDRAYVLASGADRILDHAKIYDSVGAATADCVHVYATTARQREQVKPEVSAREFACEISKHNDKVGILFGKESVGLSNDEIAEANTILHIPMNPEHFSLNLAQAVLLVAYEWRQASTSFEPSVGKPPQPLAPKREVDLLLDRLVADLDARGFFVVPEKRDRMIRNVKNIFTGRPLTSREVSTLHGIIAFLKGQDK